MKVVMVLAIAALAAAAARAQTPAGPGDIGLLDARRNLNAIQIDAPVTRADHARALAALRAAVEALPAESEYEGLKEESMERKP